LLRFVFSLTALGPVSYRSKFAERLQRISRSVSLSMNRKVECPFRAVSSFWWGEATDEPAREDARSTNRVHGSDARPILEVEALSMNFLIRRQVWD